MSIIHTYYGQPSYTLKSSLADVQISVQGGHLTANYYNESGERKKITPYFIAPWWEEAPYSGQDEILKVLRGDFFCFPFGGNEEAYNNRKYPVHGETANRNWDFVSHTETASESEIVLTMDLAIDKGTVDKTIKLVKDEPVIYSTHTVKGFSGSAPVGHHPILKFPQVPGAGIIDISPPITGFTTPKAIEDPASGGYSRIKPGEEITDMTCIPCMDGSSIDISRYPTSFGFEDIVVFISNPEPEFVYSAVSVPSEGYLYFQLKNPKVLAETLFWMSNGGRHYEPWNGRIRGVLGLEEITGFYHYGIKASTGKNFFKDKGYKSSIAFTESSRFDIKLIMGAVPVSKNYKGVKDIIRKDNAAITILGRGGEHTDVPCRVDFLADNRQG